MTDEIIIKAIRNGKAEGYEKLVKRYKNNLFFYINGMVWNLEDTEDLMMITFRKAFQHLNRWDGTCKFSTWITTIAKNTVLDHIRTRAKRIDASANIDDYRGLKDINFNPVEKLISDEQVFLINECIKELPGKMQMVVKYRVFGYSDVETAEMMGITHVSVRAHLTRARTKLKKLIYEKNNIAISHCVA